MQSPSRFARILVAWASAWSLDGAELAEGSALAALFASQVDRRLEIPESEQLFYGELMKETLLQAGQALTPAQYVVLVDRNPFVQMVMVYWISESASPHYIGASPAATGKPGRFEYFTTPTGVYQHTLSNLDFRAEGTRNKFGIRGYGRKGMRVYDFGWIGAPRGWGDGHQGVMRLQLHATDPDLLEPKLGVAASKGCVRIPATLNTFLDHYGVLDGDYQRAIQKGRKFSVLLATREPTAWCGTQLVIVDSLRNERPPWSPGPKKHPAPIKGGPSVAR